MEASFSTRFANENFRTISSKFKRKNILGNNYGGYELSMCLERHKYVKVHVFRGASLHNPYKN